MKKNLKVLELFAGSRSIGKAAEELGHQVFSSDIEQFGGIDYVIDVLKFDYKQVLFIPDVIWASPPCTSFSVASMYHHWKYIDGQPVPQTDRARLGVMLAKKAWTIIRHYQKLNPNLVFYIENPRGMLRKMPFMGGVRRETVTYCQYGEDRMKPTDIWTNSAGWKPKPICKNGAPCHVAAPRGAKTGTQGMRGSYLKSVIPHELSIEVIKSI